MKHLESNIWPIAERFAAGFETRAILMSGMGRLKLVSPLRVESSHFTNESTERALQRRKPDPLDLVSLAWRRSTQVGNQLYWFFTCCQTA